MYASIYANELVDWLAIDKNESEDTVLSLLFPDIFDSSSIYVTFWPGLLVAFIASAIS